MAQKRTSASEMLSGLKSRLGFAHTDEEEFDEEYSHFDGDMDDYDDFEDDYSSDYDDHEGDRYDKSKTSSRLSTTRSSRFGHPESTPNLVSIDDVREHNKTVINSSRGSYESAHRDRNESGYTSSGAYVPATGSVSNRYTSTYQRNSLGRELVDAGTSPYSANQRGVSRSEGLDSLFQPSSHTSSASATSGYTPSSSTYGIRRNLVTLQPRIYNDVEGVARALKAGNAVVLVMTSTPDDLYKRILDFSFGVASALDAHVDNIADKVYVLAVGPALNEEEMQQLRSQGAL